MAAVGAGPLEAVAGDLYGLVPGAFTAARNAAAKQAKADGDKALAASITALRKPSAGAWLANAMVRHRAEAVDQLLALGAALREAQSSLAADELRRLSRERHRVVAAVAADGRGLADELGNPVGAKAVEELTSTLEAAMADPSAEAELRAGQLTVALDRAHFGSVSGAPPSPAPPPVAAEQPAAADGPDPAEAAASRAEDRRRAEEHLAEIADADRAVTAAEAALADVSAEASATEDAVTRAGERLEELEDRLAALRRERDEASRAVDTAEEDRRRTRDAVRTATRDLEAAREKRTSLA